ncbi:MAG TPA: hypothetical protein VJ183_01755 [Chloroflexia bacterium]|nr:hypothetical protein [Chloroflexia bacterium]
MRAQHQTITRKLTLGTFAALVAVAAFSLSGCQDSRPVPVPTPTTVSKSVTPEPNFAFIFEWTTCGVYTLTTFDNKLTLMRMMQPPAFTIDFTLSEQELGKIYQKMVDIDLFTYPQEFSIQLPPDVMRVYGIASRYHFDIQSGSQRKVVSWNDEFSEPADMPWRAEDSEPGKTQAAKLRELIELIKQIVKSHPEFKQLPTPAGCG